MEFFLKFFDPIIKFLGFFASIFFPGRLIEFQIRITRLKFKNSVGVSDFSSLYEETFPYDGSDYTADELLDALEDPTNEKKHIPADNIFLLATYKGKPAGFITCFYYPELKYGIIGHLGKTKKIEDSERFVTKKLMKKLNSLLLKYNCKLIVFEIKIGNKGDPKARLFKSTANELNLNTFELNFDYWRPKMNLDDLQEEKLRLIIVPIKEYVNRSMDKAEVMEILNFLHFCCYGDFYDIADPNHLTFHDYLKQRIAFYEQSLPDTIQVK